MKWKYDTWSTRIGVVIGCGIGIMYTFLIDTIQGIREVTLYFLLIFGIITIIELIFEIDKRRRVERINKLWK